MAKGKERQYFKVIAAAAAKSLQLCPTLCDPIDGRPPPIKINKLKKRKNPNILAPDIRLPISRTVRK